MIQEKEFVILVDEKDNELGEMEKLEVHQKGILHRAISVFVFNAQNELLLQQRAFSKYHSGGLWTNTACSHPRKGEQNKTAAERRLNEEMGINCQLEPTFSFVYKAELENGLTEHEYDHVFTGIFNGTPELNPAEVCAYRWVSEEKLKSELKDHPEHFTAWFRIIMQHHATNLYPTPRIE